MSDEDIPKVRPADVEEHPDDGVDANDFADLESMPLSDAMSDALENIETTTAADLDPVTKDDAFRAATLRLLDGEITVDEWLDTAAAALNRQIDLPWIPEVVEAKIFEYALKLAGQTLHGFLRGGTENSPTDG